jgi:hypothetical protein
LRIDRAPHYHAPLKPSLASGKQLKNAAYGWKSDSSDEEILEKLLALNLERAKYRVDDIRFW